jgi:hypothetical protein
MRALMLRNVVEATGRCVVHEAQVAKARTEDCPNMCAGVFADAVKQLQYFLYNDTIKVKAHLMAGCAARG